MPDEQDIINKDYELSFMIKNEEQAPLLKFLKNREFSVFKEALLNKVKLSYSIKKENQAYFGYIHFKGQPKLIRDLTADLKTLPELLRFLIITPPMVKKTGGNFFLTRRRSIKKEVIGAPTTLSNEALEKKIEEILK